MKRAISVIYLFFLVAVVGVFAQSPAQWRINVKMVSETEGIVTVKGLLEPGWHIYGIDLPKGGPHATSLDFSNSEGVKFSGGTTFSPKPKTGIDKIFNLKLNWWDTDVVFRRKFIVSKHPAKLVCTVKYMGCNDNECSIPQTKKLERIIP